MVRAGPAGDVHGRGRRAPDIIGTDPEQHADDRFALDTEPLIDTAFGMLRVIARNEQTLKRLGTRKNATITPVGREEVDPGTPEFPPLPSPTHGATFAERLGGDQQ
jgi:hypothetical protein